MSDDPRCCGSGTCIIDSQGRCWCGQQWDGLKMCHAPLGHAPGAASTEAMASAPTAAGGASWQARTPGPGQTKP